VATYLLDTNVVLRFLDINSPLNSLVRRAVTQLKSHGHTLKICPQNITETWAVATRPLEANGFGWSLEQTRLEIDTLLSIYELLPDTPAIFTAWLELVTRYKVSGKQVHDARLAAVAKAHRIDNLLTLNTDDFKRFDLNAVHPEDVVM
jgi:predicted nucleic acid-binding protein